MNNNLTLSVTLTGDGRQLSGTLKDAQGDVREFSATTERESRKAETALTAPGRSATTVSEHLRETQREARNFGTEATRGGREANQALAQTGQQAQTTTNHLSSLRRMAGLALGAFSVRQVAGMVDGWSDMQSVVGAAIGDMSEAGDMMRRITDIANASYAPLEQTARTYASNVSALRDLGRTAADTADYTESLNHMLVLTATRGQQAESVQNALSRAMAVGRLQADGLETVLANGGEVAQALANQLGVTVSQLRGLATEGRITGDVIASALIGSLDDVRDRAGEMPATIEDGFVRIGTSATRLVGELDQALGTSEGVAGILIGVADALTATIDPLINNIDTLQSGITVVGVAAGAYVTYRSVLIAATAAQWAFNTAVRANPLGLAITLLGAAAGALIAYRQEVTLAGGESFQTSLDVDGLASSFRLLTEAQQENKRASLVADLVEMRIEAGRLGNEVLAVSRKVRESGQLTPEGGALPIATAEDIARGRELRQELGTLLKDIDGGTKLLGQYDQAMEGLGQTTTGTATRTRVLADASTASSKAAREAAAAANELTKATEAQATALEELRNRLIPGRREVVQLARDMQTLTLAMAMGTGNVAQNIQMMGLLQQQYIEAQKDTDDLADKTVKAAFTMEGAWDEVRLNGLRRLDDGFVSLWEGAIDGSLNAAELMKKALAQTLAEMAHMAITRPITVQLATSMGFGGTGIQTAGAASSGGFGINPGSINNAWQAMQGGFNGIQWGGAGGAQAYGGGGFANAATQGTGATGYLGGSMQNFSGMQAVASAGTGIAGGYAGTQIGQSLFGKDASSSYGATGGALAGTYFGGPIGAAIGGAIGGAIDAAFGRNKKTFDFDFVQGQHSYVFGDETSAFGDSGLTNLSDFKLGEQQDALKEMLSAMADFDNQLAASAIPERFDAMKASIDGFTHSGPDDLFETRLRQMITGGQVLAADAIASIVDPEVLSQAMLGALQLEGIGKELGGQVLADITTEIEQFSGNSVADAITRMTEAAMAADLLSSASSALNLQFDITAAGAVNAAGSIAEIAGGVQNLAAIQQGYYQATFSETERLSRSQADLRASLSSVTDQVPTTVAELRALVEAQDMNTDAGGRLAVQLMQLAPAMDETNTAVRRMLEQQYQDTLGRAPDAAGMEYWFNQVATGSATLEQALAAIAGSAEAAGHAANGATGSMDTVASVLREREQLERQFLQAIGATEQLRALELRTIDESNRPLQQRIWAINDEQDAIRKAQARQQERNRTITQETNALARYREQLASFGTGIRNWMDQLDGTEAGLGTPQQQLDASDAAFWAQYEQALAGDRSAQQSITQYADRYIDNLKSMYASSENATGGIAEIRDAMAKLPEMLSAEQYLSDEFKKALGEQTTVLNATLDLNRDGTVSALEQVVASQFTSGQRLQNALYGEMATLGSTVLTYSQVRAALAPHATDAEIERLIRRVDINGDGLIDAYELTNARLVSLGPGIAQSLAPLFDDIDIDASGVIDYSEFASAFDGMATDAQLKNIFTAIDTNGDGTISRLEAIAASTSSLVSLWAQQQPGDVQSAISDITRMYESALGRAPDLPGMQYWIDEWLSGASLSTIQKSINQHVGRDPGATTGSNSGNSSGSTGSGSGSGITPPQREPRPFWTRVLAAEWSDIQRTVVKSYQSGDQRKAVQSYADSRGVTIPAYATGAWELPNDQLAMVHAGELIVPSANGIADEFREYASGNYHSELLSEISKMRPMAPPRMPPMNQFPLLDFSDFLQELKDIKRELKQAHEEKKRLMETIAKRTGEAGQVASDSARRAEQQRGQQVEELQALNRAGKTRGRTV